MTYKAFWVKRFFFEGDSGVTDEFIAFSTSLQKKKKIENIDFDHAFKFISIRTRLHTFWNNLSWLFIILHNFTLRVLDTHFVCRKFYWSQIVTVPLIEPTFFGFFSLSIFAIFYKKPVYHYHKRSHEIILNE